MPLLADRLRLQQACPYWHALGIELMEWGAGRAVTRMQPSAPIAVAPDDSRIDPLALVGMLDDGFSNAFASLLPIAAGMSTLDLRIGFAQADPPKDVVVAETRATMLDSHCATADAVMRDAGGGVVATGTAMFSLGGYAGGTPPDFTLIGRYDRATAPDTFSALIGLTEDAGEAALAGGNPHVIGWESSRALHGGAIGALLMAACRRRGAALAPGQRLASLYIRYLRPGSADNPLVSRSAVERLGRAASYVTARCFHEESRTVATAHATLVAR